MNKTRVNTSLHYSFASAQPSAEGGHRIAFPEKNSTFHFEKLFDMQEHRKFRFEVLLENCINFDMTQNTRFLQPSIYGKFMFIFDSDSYQKESLRWQFLLSFRSGTFQYWASFMGHHPTFSLLSRPDDNHFPAWDHYYII